MRKEILAVSLASNLGQGGRVLVMSRAAGLHVLAYEFTYKAGCCQPGSLFLSRGCFVHAKLGASVVIFS